METPLTANSFWQLLKVSEDGDRCIPYYCTELLRGVVVGSEGLQPVTSSRQKPPCIRRPCVLKVSPGISNSYHKICEAHPPMVK